MSYEWFAEAFQRYLAALEQSQHRLLDAQQEACRSWAAAWSPAYPLPDVEVQRRIDGSLLSGVSLLQAQADNQRDLMLLNEKCWSELNRNMQASLQRAGLHPSLDVMRQALQLGQASGSAFSKASRQVGHFAATRLSSASLNAVHDMRKVWKQSKAV
ncbi:hypothetical protein [uncultured Aquitalea sp.]|uniref:hypothetical protein n=1 Tax=uncultured Aquitalea sp. TaxID=540272 RepID=UPI0025EAE306|nr:hypothetical protein [uncultured Aquitalea sp.]